MASPIFPITFGSAPQDARKAALLDIMRKLTASGVAPSDLIIAAAINAIQCDGGESIDRALTMLDTILGVDGDGTAKAQVTRVAGAKQRVGF